MMLPEHDRTLREHKAEQQWTEEHRRPLLDEQEQERLQRTLAAAVAEKRALTITVLNANGYRVYRGIVLRTDTAAGTIILAAGGLRPEKICAAEVVALKLTEDE